MSAGVVLFVAHPALLPSPAAASIGLQMTSGPNGYSRRALDAGFDISPNVGLGIGYSQSTSSTTTVPQRTLSANCSVRISDHFDTFFNLFNSPEAEGYRYYGWGAGGSYFAGTGDLRFVLSLSLNRATHSQYVGLKKRSWADFGQVSLEPYASCTIRERLKLKAASSVYSYTEDLRTLSQYTGRFASRNAVLGNIDSLIGGFPDRSATFGVAYRVLDTLELGADWTTLSYVLDHPAETSALYSLTFAPGPHWELGTSYSVLSNQDTYYSLGITWTW